MSVVLSNQSIEKKIEKHKAFWNKEQVRSPVVGIFLGSWTFFKDNRGGDNIWSSKKISPNDIHPESFIEDYEMLFQTEEDMGDDFEDMNKLVESLNKIQAHRKCLILRGVFSVEELVLICQIVSPTGFCIHSVVKTKQQASEHISILKEKWA